MTSPYKGVYYILDAVLFPTQIIVTRELRKEDHTWLKALSSQLEKQEMKELLDKIYNLTHKFDRELADAVLEVSVKANQAVVGELRGDESMCQALLEIMEPEISKIADEAATKETSTGTALKMLKTGKFSAEEIHEYVPLLSVEEIKTLGRK